jgi:hypothetical protein
MGNVLPKSISTSFEEKPNSFERKNRLFQTLGAEDDKFSEKMVNRKSCSIIDDVKFSLVLQSFSIDSYQISYKIIIENQKDEDIVIKQIIFNEKIKWWRNFCIKVVLPSDKISLSLKTVLSDYNEDLLEQMYINQKLESFQYLTVPKKQKLESDEIKVQFFSVKDTTDKKVNEFLEKISENAHKSGVYFVAEYIIVKLPLDKSYREKKLKSKNCTVWKNQIYPISTQEIQFKIEEKVKQDEKINEKTNVGEECKN